ncbi:MAG: hypothetical protein ACI9EW_003968 [Cellvibrionaceae bacterium]|jgi:hypothetical protein
MESDKKVNLSRRGAIKAIIATTGAVTITQLPVVWSTPILNLAVLPVHAQTSTATETATSTQASTPTQTAAPTETATPTQTAAPTETATQTATPIIYTITTCHVSNAAVPSNPINTIDVMASFAIIAPAMAGIQLRRRIILNQTGHPLDGQDIDNVTGTTDASGRFSPADFDFSTVATLDPGIDRIAVRWEFVTSTDGTSVCINLIELV